jgi:hypothetical protein
MRSAPLLTALYCSVAISQAQISLPKPSRHVPAVLVVGERSDLDRNSTLVSQFAVRKRLPNIGVSVIEVPEDQLDRTQELLVSSGQFRYVEKDYYAYADNFIPNDPQVPNQWYLNTITAPAAWSTTLGSSGLVIAIIDSGIDPTQEDLIGKIVPGKDYINNSSDTSDDYSHGTPVAAVAAATADNAIGMAGVCPFCRVMPLRVIASDGSASYSNIAAAIMYGADQGARIENISAGGTASSTALQDAVNYAWSKGVTIFASSGNTGSTTRTYPAACTNVIAVAATTSTDALASYSNYGSWITLSAPGDNILSANNGAGYSYWSGTSLASPVAAAVAALALSANPSLTNTKLVSLLESNSDDLGTSGFDNTYGWGRVDASRLVAAAVKASGVPAIAISPSQVTINAPHPQQFTVTGIATVSVAWSLVPAVGTISAAGLYTPPSTVSGSASITVFANVSGGPVLVAQLNILQPTGSARYSSTDLNSEGDWKSNYGASGYLIAGDSSNPPAALSVTLPASPVFIFSNPATDPRGLISASAQSSIGAAWLDTNSLSFGFKFADASIHQVAFYAVDWDNSSRSEVVQLLDTSGDILDQRTLSHFRGGAYLVWNISGQVNVTVKRLGGPSAVLSGIFVGGSAQPTSASFLGFDSATQGNWMGQYGSSGYSVAGASPSLPNFAAMAAPLATTMTWAPSTGDPRALEAPASGIGMATAWNAGALTADIVFRDTAPHQVAFYFLDWNLENVSETVEVLDANDKLLNIQHLSNFGYGVYLIYNLSGHVRVKVTNAASQEIRAASLANVPFGLPEKKDNGAATLSGIFF